MSTAVLPVKRIPYFTPGVWILTALAALGLASAFYRFVFSLEAATNLDGQYPWGIWIGIDVACGVALAAGGFTSSFIAHIMHRERYAVLTRPALLTAMLGYTFVALGVVIDLGRYYWIWHVLLPSMWQGNSALFEVGICVVSYLTVLYIEFIPILTERFRSRVNLPGIMKSLNNATEGLLKFLDNTFGKAMFIFIILGVVLSCMHQSSLGTLMVIVPSKLHPLWHTPILSLLFLLSAFAVGIAMVIFESLLASWSFKLKPEISILSQYARYLPLLLWIYLFAKTLDMVNRGTFHYVLEGTVESWFFNAEMLIGVIYPIVVLSSRRFRKQIIWLFSGAAAVVVGVVLNRVNVFIVGYQPPYAESRYIPAITEILVTVGFISLLILVYRFFVIHFPVIEELEHKKHA